MQKTQFGKEELGYFTNHDELTPLHFASMRGYLEIVQYLVEKGADLNAKGYV